MVMTFGCILVSGLKADKYFVCLNVALAPYAKRKLRWKPQVVGTIDGVSVGGGENSSGREAVRLNMREQEFKPAAIQFHVAVQDSDPGSGGGAPTAIDGAGGALDSPPFR